ncbi:Ku protein [Paenibacillus hamazuiensis]|uniref:non-homologous end joining protein Ku n=1 Tax=Paenibacillus hamazuiensis TaxID=2936508 RepID=UPI00200C34B5
MERHSLHTSCLQPIQYKKWCPSCRCEIQQHEIVRGYEYAPGNFITLTEEDMDKLPLPTLRTIEILHFTNRDNIDPIYFENAYYLGPGAFGDRSYRLLHAAMSQTGMVAVAKIAFRTSEHLTVLRLHRNCLLLNFIYYPSEIRPVTEVPGLQDGAPFTESELQMAVQLINQIGGGFRNDYRSDYEAALRELIHAKIQNRPVQQPQMAPVVDLMEALQRSLAAIGQPHVMAPETATPAFPKVAPETSPAGSTAIKVPDSASATLSTGRSRRRR